MRVIKSIQTELFCSCELHFSDPNICRNFSDPNSCRNFSDPNSCRIFSFLRKNVQKIFLTDHSKKNSRESLGGVGTVYM